MNPTLSDEQLMRVKQLAAVAACDTYSQVLIRELEKLSNSKDGKYTVPPLDGEFNHIAVLMSDQGGPIHVMHATWRLTSNEEVVKEVMSKLTVRKHIRASGSD